MVTRRPSTKIAKIDQIPSKIGPPGGVAYREKTLKVFSSETDGQNSK